MAAVKQFENLNTSYVNLAALLRYLREQNFSGAIHLAHDQYEAEMFLNGSGSTAVFEIDRASGLPAPQDGALERMLVHAREPGGTITVYEGKTQPGSAAALSEEQQQSSNTNSVSEAQTQPGTTGQAFESSVAGFADQLPAPASVPAVRVDWDDLLRASADVIGAIERAIVSVDADFDTNFRAACISLGDDYPFLDPTLSNFKYANGTVTPGTRPQAAAYVAGLSECLRRVVNKLAIDKEGNRFRERVAVELAVAARLRPLGDFKGQLDRIAGTRVL